MWIKTSEHFPVAHSAVLGLWPPNNIQTVVYRGHNQWNAPGYYYSEKRNPPEYWAFIPDLPSKYDNLSKPS